MIIIKVESHTFPMAVAEKEHSFTLQGFPEYHCRHREVAHVSDTSAREEAK